MKNNFFYSISALLFAFALIAGCGGGGGSSNPVAPETSTTTATSTATASETATSTATNTGSDTATGTETSTGTATSTSTETSTETSTDTGTETGTSTVTWANVLTPDDIEGKWQNYREYKAAGGDVEKTWKDRFSNGMPAFEFATSSAELTIEVTNELIANPNISKTIFYDEASVASDSAEIWTTAPSEDLDTYYVIDPAQSKINLIIDPTNSSPPNYLKRTFNIRIYNDGVDDFMKLYGDIGSDYLILKKLP